MAYKVIIDINAITELQEGIDYYTLQKSGLGKRF